MTIDYKILVDWDNDGFINEDAQVGDPLNELPDAADLNERRFFIQVAGTATIITGVSGKSPYGLSRIEWNTTTGASTLAIGYDSSTLSPFEPDIPLTKGVDYRLMIWWRKTSGGGNTTLTIDIFQDNGGGGVFILNNEPLISPLSSNWTLSTIEFTTSLAASDNGIGFRLEKPSSSTVDFTWEIGGIMIVPEADYYAGLGFNAGAESNLYDNLTPLVIEATWNVGFRRPWQVMCDEGRARFVLDNCTRAFSPEAPASVINGATIDSAQVMVKATYTGGTETTLYTGWIQAITPQTGINRAKRAVLDCENGRTYLDRGIFYPAMQLSKTADELVDFVLAGVNGPPQGWVTTANGTTVTTVGSHTYSYYFDNLEDGANALTQIRHIVGAETAKFYFDRNAEPSLLSQKDFRYSAIAPPTALDLDGTDFIAADYRYADHVFDVIEMMVYPRRFVSPPQQVWEWDEAPITLASGETRYIRARYFDGTSFRWETGVRNVTSSDSHTSTLNVTVTEGAKSADLVVEAPFGSNVTYLRLSGNLVQTDHPLRVTAPIITTGNELRVLTLDYKLMDDSDYAQDMVQQYRDRHLGSQGAIYSVDFPMKDTLEATLIDNDIGTIMTISDDQVEYGGLAVIIGEEWRLTDGLKRREVRWYLEPGVAVAVP